MRMQGVLDGVRRGPQGAPGPPAELVALRACTAAIAAAAPRSSLRGDVEAFLGGVTAERTILVPAGHIFLYFQVLF